MRVEIGQTYDLFKNGGIALIKMISSDAQSLLLEMETPLFFSNGEKISFLVVNIRHEGESYNSLLKSEWCSANATAIPLDRLSSDDTVFDLSWWKGGGADITSMRLLGNLSTANHGRAIRGQTQNIKISEK